MGKFSTGAFCVSLTASAAGLAGCNDVALSQYELEEVVPVEAEPPAAEPEAEPEAPVEPEAEAPPEEAPTTPEETPAEPIPPGQRAAIPCSILLADITLVKNTTKIRKLDLESTTIQLDHAVGYEAHINNTGAATEADVVMQGYIEQGASDCAAAGGRVVGDVPRGETKAHFTANALNAPQVVRSGYLQPGAATFRLFLTQSGEYLDEVRVAITLTE